MPHAWVLAVLAWQAAAPACQTPKPTINLVAEPSSVSIGSDFSVDEIAALAHQTGSESTAPLGFYAAEIFHTVKVRFATGFGHECPGPIGIEVEIRLFNRRIEIGRELRQRTCRYVIALQHYQRKADADAATFATYVTAIAQALQTTRLPGDLGAGGKGSGAETRTLVENWVQGVVQPYLQQLHSARVFAMRAADDLPDSHQAIEGCSSHA